MRETTLVRSRLRTWSALALYAACATAGCEDPIPPIPTTIAVSPTTATLKSIGETVQLTAIVRDERGSKMSNVSVTWGSDDPSVASVSASDTGLVAAKANGEATITASVGSAEATARVTVKQIPAEVIVTPPTDTLVALGDTVWLIAVAVDANGHPVQGVSPFLWSSDDTAVATVDTVGVVTGVGNGEVAVNATTGRVAGTATVTVMQAADSIVVSASVDTVFPGDTVRFTARAFDENGHEVADAVFEWISSNTAIARVDDTGLVQAIAMGQATIAATRDDSRASADLTVLDSPDRDALVAFYEATNGTDWWNKSGWLSEQPLNTWRGVKTNEWGRVVDIFLASNNLTGRIPPEIGKLEKLENLFLGYLLLAAPIPPELGELTALKKLTLWGKFLEKIPGPIPPELGRLANLETLYLGQFRLKGSIPPELGDLASLTRLTLHDNNLTSIPPELGKLAKLESLYLSDNDLTNIPPELGELAALRGLYLSGNNLTSIPPELGKLAALEWLNLSNNALTGPIPPEFGELSALERLRLSGNASTGAPMKLPPEFGGLAELEWLDLSGNRLTSIPPEFGKLVALDTLDLSDNALTSLPSEFGDVAGLKWLRLNDNDLTNIPPELGKLTELEWLWLNDNDLTAIPSELGRLGALKWLFLNDNDLTSIPPELGELGEQVELWGLDLSGNHLTDIPPELGEAEILRLWLNDNELTGIPPELGKLAKTIKLILSNNALAGPIPPEFSELVTLDSLDVSGNALSGQIPPELVDLEELRSLYFWDNDGLCLAGIPAFRRWFRSSVGNGPLCNRQDWTSLRALYDRTGGADWTNASGWLGVPILADWHGVTADSLGRVRKLDLGSNGLDGEIPQEIADLAEAVELRLGDNDLRGRLPLTLTRLQLQVFHYDGTELCTPSDEAFEDWLESIPDHEGTGVECEPLGDREVLVQLYNQMGGVDWRNDMNWLSDRPLEEWYGVNTDTAGRVTRLDLHSNYLSGFIPSELSDLVALRVLNLGGNGEMVGRIPPELGKLTALDSLKLWGGLTGPIPPELGKLAVLRSLDLPGNDLSGPIPPELGELTGLESLDLPGNDLSGPIPPELGELAALGFLDLRRNNLSGRIPPALGQLEALERLYLNDNALVGAVPPELGGLTALETLYLHNNDLSGSIPPEFGKLRNLNWVLLTDNHDLSGALPNTMTGLTRLRGFWAGNTGLCVPSDDSRFRWWLERLPFKQVDSCMPATAYLTQAVQTRNQYGTVPLVAGEEALLRVFLVAAKKTDVHIPDVTARFYLDGSEVEIIDIPGKASAIPAKIDEGDLWKSVNAKVPARTVKPGLEVVVEIDSVDVSLGVPRRIPVEGRLEIPVYAMPSLNLTLVPFLYSEDPDSSIILRIDNMADDPEAHELLADTRTLLPVGGLDVTAHEPVTIDSRSGRQVLYATTAIRVAEGGRGHYMGMMTEFTDVRGVAYWPGRTSASVPNSYVMAHELGHNMNLGHAPCDLPLKPGYWPDSFPNLDGHIGSYGYDFDRRRAVPPDTPDLMGYCSPRWVSGYHFEKALRHRLATERRESSPSAPSVQSLLLWGGTDSIGQPFLEPSFVVQAPPALPTDGGDHVLRGLDAAGGELFSLPFHMPELADADGHSSFAFVLPADSEWADALASITLSGPGGTATLDSRTHRPSAFVRDPVSGQVRAILLNLPQAIGTWEEAAALLSVGTSLELLFSRGIPDARAWRQ